MPRELSIYSYIHSEKGKATRKRYEQSNAGKLQHKRYKQSDKGKLSSKKYRENHVESIKLCAFEYRQNHKKQSNAYNQQYIQTTHGKTIRKKAQAKRKRNLGFNLMYDNPFDESEVIDYHHINDSDVVILPRDLHNLYMGEFHRENVEILVKQIYGGE